MVGAPQILIGGKRDISVGGRLPSSSSTRATIQARNLPTYNWSCFRNIPSATNARSAPSKEENRPNRARAPDSKFKVKLGDRPSAARFNRVPFKLLIPLMLPRVRFLQSRIRSSNCPFWPPFLYQVSRRPSFLLVPGGKAFRFRESESPFAASASTSRSDSPFPCVHSASPEVLILVFFRSSNG